MFFSFLSQRGQIEYQVYNVEFFREQSLNLHFFNKIYIPSINQVASELSLQDSFPFSRHDVFFPIFITRCYSIQICRRNLNNNHKTLENALVYWSHNVFFGLFSFHDRSIIFISLTVKDKTAARKGWLCITRDCCQITVGGLSRNITVL